MCADQPATRAQPNIARRQVGRDLRVVEHDGRPVLHIRLELTIGRPLVQHLERRLLERGRHLDARRPELHRRALEHGRARVVGAIDTMAEAHDPLAAGKHVVQVLLEIVRALGALDHRQDPRRRAAVQRAGQRPDRRRHRRGAVGAGRRGDARGERRRVQPVLGRRDPVRVERLHVARVRLAAPADQEPRGGVLALRNLGLGHRRSACRAQPGRRS